MTEETKIDSFGQIVHTIVLLSKRNVLIDI